MFWITLLVLCIVFLIVGIVLAVVGFELAPILMIAIGLTGTLIFGLGVPTTIVSNNNDISIFKDQKQYIENVKSDNPIEDAALTQKKIEYNDWLFKEQNFYKNYQIFSLMPSEILYLEPIQ